MSVKENPCKKFQANIFNKSKCQNCFKPRESHLLSDEDLNQAKPIYGGWLLLAPEGTDFDNPVHRSRKWQRRFFILYEHGLLRYALDEMPTTLPQGTINMNQCTDVIDGENRTGQKYSLCILTPEEHFIRAENKEIINGWLEMLIIYPKTNKQNQKKKRKVEPPTPQEPGPAKMAATSSGIPSAEKVPATKSTLWQEEVKNQEVQESSNSPLQSPVQMPSSPSEPMADGKADEALVNGDRTDGGRKTRVESGYFSLEKTKDLKTEEQLSPTPPSPSTPDAPNRYSAPNSLSLELDPFFPTGVLHVQQPKPQQDEVECNGHCPLYIANRQYAILADVPRARRISHREAFQVERRRLEQKTRARSPGREEVERLFGQQRRRSLVIEKFEALDIEKAEHMETNSSSAPSGETRQGRSEKRNFPRKRDESGVGSIPDVSASPMSPYRRAKSLDRRSSESSTTPDLLNFKKGWLTKQYQDGQWKKHWFVLTDQTLRFYRDSVAEEAADLDGEIDLSTCYDVTEFPVQRNYGFQIHTKEGQFTLSAMTSGIRRNWIQTIMKHVRPSPAPDVTSSLPEEKSKTSSFSNSSALSNKQDSEHSEGEVEQKRSRARERRREGRSKTFDWAEFRPIQQALAQERAQAAEALKSVSSYDTTDSKNDQGELERERARRREERRKRFESSDSVEESAGEDASRMEVDRGPAPSDTVDSRPNVQVEIEQRWQQVETTPLREEKQIPIAPLPTSPQTLPSEDITALLEKQLEQSQKEVADLLEENLVLQHRLKEALEQQQSARDGYVLQTELADPSSDAWQRLHKVNEDLQSELESQCRRQELLNHQMQTMKHSCAEAKDSIRHQEAEILSLQARLNSASAELSTKEQALTKQKGDLKLEKDKAREMFEEWQTNEAALSSQLRVSQQKLNEAESLLLEKNQELREKETEQALQRDYQKEMQRLQEKLADLRTQLEASEQARISTEERLKMSCEDLLGGYEKEKQVLLHNLKEADDRLVEYEDKLQENEQLMEILQKEKLSSNAETTILVHRLEEQLSGRESKIHNLEVRIQELEGDRDRLKTTCQEMSNQIKVSDTENTNLQDRLKAREVEFYELSISLERTSEEVLKVKERLREKEEAFRQISDTHWRVVEKKNQDINEAMIKMAALGSSLEETETKLKAKEEALRRFYSFDSDNQIKEFEMLYVQLEAAKNRIAELERNSQLQTGDVFGEMLEMNNVMEVSQAQEAPYSSLTTGEVSTLMSVGERGQDMGAKRQRIRFSSIQCQKYVQGDGSEKAWSSHSSPDTSQDHPITEDGTVQQDATQYQSSVTSDVDNYHSIIHSLETKLCETEDTLKEITSKLENEKISNQEALLGLQSQYARTETSLREQLQSSMAQVSSLAKQLEREQEDKTESMSFHPQRVQKEVFYCLETCREMIRGILSHKDSTESSYSALLSIEAALSNILGSVQQTQNCETSNTIHSAVVQCADMSTSKESQEQLSEDPVQFLLQKLDFEVKLMYKIAESLKCTSPDVHQCVEEVKQGPEDYSCVSLIDILAKKLQLERDFWSRVEHMKSLAADVHNRQSAPEVTSVREDVTSTPGTVELDPPCDVSEWCCSSHFVGQSSNPTVKSKESTCESVTSYREELSQRIEENAHVLKALISKPPTDLQDVQRLLEVSKDLSSCVNALLPCNFPPALVQEAIVQAQVQYVTCKTRLECEKEAEMNREAACRLHSEVLSRVHQDYQERLQKKQDELSGFLERERAAAEAVTNQAERAARSVLETESKYKGAMSQLENNHKKDRENLIETWTQRENFLIAEKVELQSKLEVSEQEKQNLEHCYLDQIRNLEVKFQDQLHEFRALHNKEIQTLENRYLQSIQQLQETLDTYKREHPDMSSSREKHGTAAWLEGDHNGSSNLDSMNVLRERVLELEAQMDLMRVELENKHLEGTASGLKERYQADFENLKATCERGFAAMEETHQKKIEDLQRQHQRELEKLREEKDRLLAEETAATISAIEAMKNAHREELERELEKTHRSQISSVNADVESLRRQYLEELQSVQRELEVLSEQYSQKCLENAHLAQALEAERQALRQCQRENQELNAHNQELNNRLATEITRLRTLLSRDGGGDVSPLTQGKDAYELEVLLRVKESEIQYQKQEISSLKDELQTALRDKKYTSDKYKDIYTELSNVKAKAECDISRLKEQLKTATEMLGDKTPESAAVSGYDIMKSKSNPDFLKNDRSSINRQLRNIRSKSLKEGLTVQERLKIFESQDFKKN